MGKNTCLFLQWENVQFLSRWSTDWKNNSATFGVVFHLNPFVVLWPLYENLDLSFLFIYIVIDPILEKIRFTGIRMGHLGLAAVSMVRCVAWLMQMVTWRARSKQETIVWIFIYRKFTFLSASVLDVFVAKH